MLRLPTPATMARYSTALAIFGPALLAAAAAAPAAGQCVPVWTQPAELQSGPSLRASTAIAFDAARGQVVVFGGYNAFLSRLGDTWTSDGASWILRSPTTAPSARGGHSMAADTARNRVLLFGGNSQTHLALNDLWAWDGSNWLLLDDGSGVAPPPRKDAALVYDPVRDRVVLFGGNAGGLNATQVWEWTGNSWIAASTQAGPAPAPRSQMGAAFDAVRAEVVIFGGLSGGVPSGDAWSWDGAKWTPLTPAGAAPAPRYAPAMWFDPDRGSIVLFGGNDGAAARNDLWDLRAGAWIPRPTDVAPSPRSSVVGVHDDRRGRAVVLGGFAGPLAGETWTLAFFGKVRIVNPPAGMTISPGQPLGLSVSTEGLDPQLFQWRHDGAILQNGDLGGRVSGADSPTLIIQNATASEAGLYDVAVTNDCGTLVSLPATITVSPACTADVDNGTSTGTPDGSVGIEDLLYYLDRYDDGQPVADVDDGTVSGTPDGGVGIEDLLYFLLRYDAGC